jgi:hypothetical protein
MMDSDAFKDAGEGSSFDRVMMGNYLVIFAVLLACNTDV